MATKNTKAVSQKKLLGVYLSHCEPVPGQNIEGKRLVDGGYPKLQLKEGVTAEQIADELGMKTSSFNVRASQERGKFQLSTTIIRNERGEEERISSYCQRMGKKLDEIDIESMTVVHQGIELPKFRGKTSETFDVDSALDDLLADID